MSKAIRQLLISQGIANLADVFFRVVVIANVFILSGSVIATSIVPILIGLSSFLASFLVPLVTKRVALNRVLFLTQFGKTILLAILALLLSQSGNIALPFLYYCCFNLSLRWFCSTSFIRHRSSICYRFRKGKCSPIYEW